MAGMNAAPVDSVVKTVVKALSSGRPDARYVVGRDAGQLVLVRRRAPRRRRRRADVAFS
jgi:hypothetical protein